MALFAADCIELFAKRALIETRALAGLTRLAMAQGDMAGAKAHALAAARISPDDAEIALALGFLESLRL
ncbi:hypothetical protein [Rhodospirillum rubrum]|uniref:TPR repeat n=1 Tax=Rhodospirillum rubrum (strain ATCC 11170 / ATH 1.1.1 / DSM 467 / LMG 4362 / NCIMB 8255 / S1) TaxID=269796 RepID=Q2RU75_RHORT|nr:hypothetical protein [Rhodospirillum rubrum]ABC22320.1 hypothetical protein Rru_A1520 [Rhodospirillum rubrum ATCC 11170]AEO48036.1 hypothetical protein F11_07845 [Rhodospirillum rubrum F11]MBK5953900.1 hypothetical protein [Rhodospirillum rubrum]QXG81961.1 hypothetical protein KUL73_07870 [Rhodospirillum rubrum]